MDHRPNLSGERRSLTAEEYQQLVTAAHIARSRAIAAFCVAIYKGAVRLGRRAFPDRKSHTAPRLLPR